MLEMPATAHLLMREPARGAWTFSLELCEASQPPRLLAPLVPSTPEAHDLRFFGPHELLNDFIQLAKHGGSTTSSFVLIHRGQESPGSHI